MTLVRSVINLVEENTQIHVGKILNDYSEISLRLNNWLNFVPQVALNEEIENLGKSFKDNTLDNTLGFAEAKNNQANKTSRISEEEFQMCVVFHLILPITKYISKYTGKIHGQ